MANANCPIPSNINPLMPTGFQLSITKLPEVSFFCQQASIPEIELPAALMPTPFSMIGLPGDRISFGELTVTFIVDENLSNYKAVFNWIKGLGFPENYEQYTALVAADPRGLDGKFGGMVQEYSDATLGILGSNNLPTANVVFRNVQPISLSSLQFQANVTDIQYLTGVATFRYTYYDFE